MDYDNLLKLAAFENIEVYETNLSENLKGIYLDSFIAINNRSKLNERKKSKNDVEQNINTLIKEQNSIRNQISNLTIRLSHNIESPAAQYIIKQIEELDKRINEIDKEIAYVAVENENNKIKQMNIDMLEQNLKTFLEDFDDMDIEEKKTIFRSIVKQVNWDGTNLSIEWLEL